MSLRRIFLSFFALIAAVSAAASQTERKPITIDDLFNIKGVQDVQVSPDGKWIAYTVSTTDAKADKSDTDVWLVSFDGKVNRQITFSAEGESSPRWSPDGKYLSFVSSRPGPNKGSQIWLLDLSGGEARQMTEIKGRLQGYEWSPDSKRMAMVIGDPDPDEEAVPNTGPNAKPPKPIVIDRYKFKQDVQGYLPSNRHSFVYLYDIDGKKLDRLTKSKSDESSPVWSPDGSKIAFTSNHREDPDRDPVTQIYVAEAKPGVAEKQVTPLSSRGTRGGPQWSPDGKTLAFLETDELSYGAYSMSHLTLVASDGSSSPVRVQAAEALDRGVSNPFYSPDGKSISVLVTDDRSVYPVRIDLASGQSQRLLSPPVVVQDWEQKGGRVAAIAGGDSEANEIYSFDGGKLSRLTHHNDKLFARLEIPATEEVGFKSKDGTEVHGLLTYPVGYIKGTKVPTLLRIHGGPNGQDQHSFSGERQFFAANGYAVLAVNYRGSSGRGAKFSRAIHADWGNLEVQDLQAGVDHVVAMGVADPAKLGVGGWSYGGILTDYMIASDNRFKAATSGAGTAFTVAFYGTDQYIIQYDYEIGPPWQPKAWETYQRISYPFLHADRIKTPTLFLGGERDFNVPVQGGQQMYQALKSLGVDTQLIIYPNEFHGIRRPSYVRDRYERYLAWYDKYIKGKAPEPKLSMTAWAGKWKGKLVDLPAKPGAVPVEVTMELGEFPTTDNACAVYKTTFSQSGTPDIVKDYKFCRGSGRDDLYVDEGGGVKLSSRVIGDSVVTPFKNGNNLRIATMRLRGETLEQEVLTVSDKPASAGVVPMLAQSVQRIELKRVKDEDN